MEDREEYFRRGSLSTISQNVEENADDISRRKRNIRKQRWQSIQEAEDDDNQDATIVGGGTIGLSSPARSSSAGRRKPQSVKKRQKRRPTSGQQRQQQQESNEDDDVGFLPDSRTKNFQPLSTALSLNESGDHELMVHLQDDLVEGTVDRMNQINLVNIPSNYQESQSSQKIYIERKEGKFSVKDESNLKNENQKEEKKEEVDTTTVSTALDLGLFTNSVFHKLSVFSCGLLAGVCMWQCIMVFTLSARQRFTLFDFVEHYTTLVYPTETLLYVLLVISTVAVLDRYDVAQFDWRLIERTLSFKSAGLVLVVIYVASLVISLSSTHLNDKLGLVGSNSTAWTNYQEMEDDVTSWKYLILCRGLGVVFGWILISHKSDTDLLSKHLRNHSTANLK